MTGHSDETTSDETTSSPGTDPKAADDWRGLGDLISLATERLTTLTEDMHQAIAERWFGLIGPRAAPLRRAYQASTARIYESVRTSGAALGSAVGWGAEAAGGKNGPRPLWRSSLGSGIQATANAVWGDEFERRRSNLRIELGLRDAAGELIGQDPYTLSGAFSMPTARLVVLLHGLGETEQCWQGQAGADSLGDLLATDSFTPLLVRYNTGRHVSDNGVALAALLEGITEGWPVAVEEVALLGHSMGGLVARSSIYAGREAGHRWTGMVRHLITLGSPHLGAPLEKGANLISRSLGLVPVTRPLGEFLDHRSAGIKDLRFGAIREDDWNRTDNGALPGDIVGDAPLPVGIEQHFVAGVITAEPTHPVGVLVGDLIVRTDSGTGRGRRRHVEATDIRVVGGRRHPDLPHDPAVHAQIREWLSAKTGDHPG